MADRNAHLQIRNNMPHDMVYLDGKTTEGQWRGDSPPPQTIPGGGQSGSWDSESNAFMTGTKGYVTYGIQDGSENDADPTYLKISWSVPYMGKDSCDQELGGRNADAYKITPPADFSPGQISVRLEWEIALK